MRLPDNIDKSGFRRGEYVGFTASCGTQKIRRRPGGSRVFVWETYGLASQVGTPLFLTARTLKALGVKLKIANTKMRKRMQGEAA
jgi:hypothetical protein